MNTPDTEWSEQIIDLGVQVNTVQDGDASYREYTFNDAQLEAFTSSRDTYWKEQIEKAVLKGERNRIIEQIREERDTYWRERVRKEGIVQGIELARKYMRSSREECMCNEKNHNQFDRLLKGEFEGFTPTPINKDNLK